MRQEQVRASVTSSGAPAFCKTVRSLASEVQKFLSFSGFSAYTPAQPGHVFDVRFDPATGKATWTDLTFDLGDQPVLDVALDTATGDLYAATDFGVDRLVAGASSWITAADYLPKTAVYALTLASGKKAGDRVLYAATHGRGAWRTELPDVKQKGGKG